MNLFNFILHLQIWFWLLETMSGIAISIFIGCSIVSIFEFGICKQQVYFFSDHTEKEKIQERAIGFILVDSSMGHWELKVLMANFSFLWLKLVGSPLIILFNYKQKL